jgi:hypothetical protein
MPSPYGGLTPFPQADSRFFFGRELEEEILLANLVASRLPILYGAAGVGKSSLLSAGVAARLRAQAHANLVEYGAPKLVVIVFRSWAGDPLLELGEAIRASTTELGPERAPSGSAELTKLDEIIEVCADSVDGKVLIILDQFEDYFLYHPSEDGEGAFLDELARAVNRTDLRAGFLISIRDVSVARLIPLRELIPRLFDNFQHLKHLDLRQAQAAIRAPLENYNQTLRPEDTPVTIEPELVNAVLEELRLSSFGRPGAPARVETPLIQLVMTRLWETETQAGSRTLRLETLRRLGGARRIQSQLVEESMAQLSLDEQSAAADVLPFLVTPSGTSIAQSLQDLAAYSGRDTTELRQVLEHLSAVRILRATAPPFEGADARYEIFHDVLAAGLLDWLRRQARVEQQKAPPLRRFRWR